jgi:hypothetical protein
MAGQDLGQAVPHDRGVLGNHDTHQACLGNSIVTVVGPPTGLSTSSWPSTVCTRSSRPTSPPPAVMRPAGTVIDDDHQDPALPVPHGDCDPASAAVLGGIGEQLSGTEVRDRLDGWRWPFGDADAERNGYRARPGQDGQRRA